MTSTTLRARLTYSEYSLFPKDGNRHEVIRGEHFMNPAPSLYHQTLSQRILFQLYTQIELEGRGKTFHAPVDVELGAHDIVQPDLVVVMSDREAIQIPSRLRGTPSLIVEILSPSTERNDRELKLELYRSHAVPEYWIVDPERHVVMQYVLENDDYRLAGERSESLEGVTIDELVIDLEKVC